MGDVGDGPPEVLADFSDLHRFVGGRAAALLRMGLQVESWLEDVEGNVEDGHFDCAVYMGRRVARAALSVVSAHRGGRIGMGGEPSVFHEVFEGIEPELVRTVMELTRPPEPMTLASMRPWLDDLRRAAFDAMATVGVGRTGIRQPEGMLPVMAAARDWMSAAVELGIHPAPYLSS